MAATPRWCSDATGGGCRTARFYHQRPLRRARMARWSTSSAAWPTSRARTVRFIGDAEMRIREDYLRILRFFRFFAWYGAGRPDADGLKACARLKGGFERLSAERVWAELKKLLSAARPLPCAVMDAAGERADDDASGKREVGDRRHSRPGRGGEGTAVGLPTRCCGWRRSCHPMLRRIEAMAARLRMSTAEAERLSQWASATPLAADATELIGAPEAVSPRWDGLERPSEAGARMCAQPCRQRQRALMRLPGLRVFSRWRKRGSRRRFLSPAKI